MFVKNFKYDIGEYLMIFHHMGHYLIIFMTIYEIQTKHGNIGQNKAIFDKILKYLMILDNI